MFRTQANIERMNRSCERVCTPILPEAEALEYMLEFIRIEQEWIPHSPGTSLYVRSTTIATEAALGVRSRSAPTTSSTSSFARWDPYYPEGFNPLNIYMEEKYIRAAPGGLGQAKTSANYVASLLAAEEAHAKGYTQVLWLDACDKKAIEEVSTMNIFFVIDDEIITAPLGGSIMPGVTRDSAIQLCRGWGLKANERRLTIDEVIAAQKAGTLKEAFGTGTAAVVSPVADISYQGGGYQVADGKTGPLAHRLYDEITGIQLGTRPAPFGFVVKVA